MALISQNMLKIIYYIDTASKTYLNSFKFLITCQIKISNWKLNVIQKLAYTTQFYKQIQLYYKLIGKKLEIFIYIVVLNERHILQFLKVCLLHVK